MATTSRPKDISFDGYGTSIRFRTADLVREIFADRIAPDNLE